MAEMRYASQSNVLRDLKIAESDAVTIAEVVGIENGLATLFDHRCGRSFGETTVPAQMRIVQGYATDLLLLPTGIAQVDAVEVRDPVAAESRVLDAAEWVAWGSDANGNTIGLLLTGSDSLTQWGGYQVGVTGLWGDQNIEGLVPDDVREALTTATIKEYRRRHSSYTDQIGPDGLAVPSPAGVNDPLFNETARHYRVSRRKAGV